MSITFRSLQERLREKLLTQIAAGDLTGLELARKTGFQQAHISNFLNRKRGLSLEAVDSILAAMNLSVLDLLPPQPSARRFSIHANADGCPVFPVPLVAEADCSATEVPIEGHLHDFPVAPSLLQKLRSDMRSPRRHWLRFVALRVKQSDATAMSPILRPGSVAIIDRHYNSLLPFKPSAHNVYLARVDGNYAFGYVEQMGSHLVLRGQRPDNPLQVLDRGTAADPYQPIIGRVCVVTQPT